MPFALSTETDYDLRMSLGYVPLVLTLIFLGFNIALMIILSVIQVCKTLYR